MSVEPAMLEGRRGRARVDRRHPVGEPPVHGHAEIPEPLPWLGEGARQFDAGSLHGREGRPAGKRKPERGVSWGAATPMGAGFRPA